MSDNKSKEDLYRKINRAEKELEDKTLLDGEKVFKKINKKYAGDKEVEAVAKKILGKHKAAFEELAKSESKEDYLKNEDEIFNEKSLEEIYDEAKDYWEDKE